MEPNWELVDRVLVQILFLYLLWRIYQQGKNAFRRMLEMKQNQVSMLEDLKRTSDELRERQEMLAKEAHDTHLTNRIISDGLETIQEKIDENTELTKLAAKTLVKPPPKRSGEG